MRHAIVVFAGVLFALQFFIGIRNAVRDAGTTGMAVAVTIYALLTAVLHAYLLTVAWSA